jgi:hypothetical protein
VEETMDYFRESVPDHEEQTRVLQSILAKKPALGFLPAHMAEKMAVLEWARGGFVCPE